MAFLDFLKAKGNGKAKPPDAQRADIYAALEKLAQDRASAHLVLNGLDQRRDHLLLADAPAVEILKLDEEGDLARVKMEKCDAFESELHARLSVIEGQDAEIEWRRVFSDRHRAACALAKSFNETCRLMFEFREASAAASANPIARQFGLMAEAPPLILSGESLQKFLRETEMMSDLETRRRAAVERRQEVQG